MEIQRFDKRPGCSRVVIHNHVAYFTGHVAAGKQPTLREQGEAVLKRYDELFERFGLKKENILYSNAYGIRSTLTNLEAQPAGNPHIAWVVPKGE